MIPPLAIILGKHHNQLTQEEWLFLENAGLVNGCGGKGQWLLVWILKKVTPYWAKAKCQIHDLGYLKGGTEQRRKHCDMRFLEEMLNDGFVKIDNKLHYVWYTILCVLAYSLIRIYGRRFFNYRSAGIYIN